MTFEALSLSLLARVPKNFLEVPLHRLLESAKRVFGFFLMGLAILALALGSSATWAGRLSEADVSALLGPSFVLGERNAGLPLWPLYAVVQDKVEKGEVGEKPPLLGYVFESIDFEPVKGYAGKPLDFLVAIDPQGKFLAVHLLDHKEPLFRSEKGTALLEAFGQQYVGVTPQHKIQIYHYKSKTDITETQASLHGVQGGTVSVKAINQSLLQSALTVARAHAQAMASGKEMGAEAGKSGRHSPDASTESSVRHLGWQQLLSRHMVEPFSLTRSQIESAFAKTRAAGNDPLAADHPDEVALAFHVALISHPLIGRNLLDDNGWQLLNVNRHESPAFLVTESGPLYKMRYERQRADLDMPFVLRQNGRELALRALTFDEKMPVPGYPEQVIAHVLVVEDPAGLDPAQPYTLGFKLGRRFGQFPQNVAKAEFPLPYHFGSLRMAISRLIDTPWMGTWEERILEIVVLLSALAVLTVGLIRQAWLSEKPQRLLWFRRFYLLFTLVFTGWMAQGQLSIVNVIAALDALRQGEGLGFFMNDPMTVLLWLYVGVTLFVWGRGTFCGWLCPFGALQELLSDLVQALGWQHKRLKTGWDLRLKKIKYGLLILVVGLPLMAAQWPEWGLSQGLVEMAPEVEPFKTAISAYFVRDWPFVLWAVACLVLSLVVYRGYCRYICPLGAALASVNVLQRWGWIARRQECGSPCQTCRHRCEYQAIDPKGQVDYAECFQCLDCVSIYQDDQQCLPLIQERKKRIIPILAESAS